MNADVTEVDLVGGGIIVNFADGTAAFFDSKFLYAHRSDNGNNRLPDDKREN
jgi:hypothetical protein